MNFVTCDLYTSVCTQGPLNAGTVRRDMLVILLM